MKEGKIDWVCRIYRRDAKHMPDFIQGTCKKPLVETWACMGKNVKIDLK